MLRFIDQNRQLNRSQLGFLLVAQALVVFPSFLFLPLWIPVVWLISFAWRVQIFRGLWSFPETKLKTILGILVICALAATSNGTLSEITLVGLLVSAFSLKLLEIRKVSDSVTLIFIGFITTATQFIFSTGFLQGCYSIVCLAFLLGGLMSVYQVEKHQPISLLKNSLIFVAQATPIMVVLFVMLPRLGPLWTIPSSQTNAFTGFGNSMSPGSLTKLIQSEDVAFRVTFEQYGNENNSNGESDPKGVRIPPPKERYWRGLVLDRFDGQEWSSWFESRYSPKTFYSNTPPSQWRAETIGEGSSYHYSVMLEPHQYKWLFSLMLPQSAKTSLTKLEFTEEHLIRSPKPVVQRVQYHVISTPSYSVAANYLTEYERKTNLSIPQNSNPETQRMVENWINEGLEASAIVDRVLSRFKESFSYTISPPKLSRHSVDDFFFRTQKGFCEHFSSSFVFIMRAAGIPSRVVVGYQGGEFSPNGEYLIVRQLDAHAWAEIWMEGKGWLRVDPTFSVSPDRIENGFQSSLSEVDYSSLAGDGIIQNVNRAIFDLITNFDYLNYNWHRWVLAYSGQTQENLLKKLMGSVSALKIAFYIVSTISVLGFLYYLSLMNFYIRPKRSESLKIYNRFLSRVTYASRGGLRRERGETPSVFASRVISVFPEQSEQVLEITRLFEHLVFSESSDDKSHYESVLKQAVNKLTLPRLSSRISR